MSRNNDANIAENEADKTAVISDINRMIQCQNKMITDLREANELRQQLIQVGLNFSKSYFLFPNSQK